MLPEARIAHQMRGRLRLKFTALKRDAGRLAEVCRAIESLAGVLNVDANPVTGSIRIMHVGRTDTLLSRLSDLGAEHDLFRLERAVQTKTANGAHMRKIAGRSMLAFGVAGVLLPVIPGTPFLIAGAALLGRDDPMVARGVKLAQNLGTAWRFLRAGR